MRSSSSLRSHPWQFGQFSWIVALFLQIVLLLDVAKCQLENKPPYFVPGSGDMARFSLSENTPVGSPVYQLKGIDPEGSKLKYSISGPVFSVDRDTGVVRLRQELDRESQNLIELILSITDEGIYGTEPNTISLRREIPVRDYNDNNPIFIGRPYSVSVSEATSIGSILEVKPNIIVTDRDEGINSEVELRCFQETKSENDICDTFDVKAEKISEGNFTARLSLLKELDFESRPSYIMTIMARDKAIGNQLSSFATVSINVVDVQDQPPVFTNAPYSATVEENTPTDQSILTITAIDGDIGIPRPVSLTLEDEPFGHFKLEPIGSPKEGKAILRTTDIPLDRENPEILQNGGVYVFTVKATELINGEESEDFSKTQVTIVVTDVDDHDPEFNEDLFNISIPENLRNGMALPGLSVFINDKDMGDNSRYQLALRPIKNANQVFSVSPTVSQGRTPVVVKILDSSKLDYDVKDPSLRIFEFDLVALVNGEEKSSARVIVNLLDANDNSPIFQQNAYRFKIEENRPGGTKIGDIKATDKDSNDFGAINYLLKGFGSDNFYTDPETGGLYISKSLDYEKQSSYSLTIVAKDGGGRESNANVFVDVVDLNDNHPVFESSEYTRTVREGAIDFEPQFFVRAIDIDGPAQGGGRIKYAIVSENSISGNVFQISEPTGEITLQKAAKSMDTERGEYELVVSATDYGTPALTNTTRVLVRVGISGNQRPIFKGHFQNTEHVPVIGPPSYRVSIPENALSGFNVTTVSALDPDGLDSLLRYRIVGANDNFVINERSGLIQVSPQARLDRDSNMDNFEIVVNAVDAGVPIPETATTTVYVNIKDINDEPPKFEHSSYIGYVSERTDIGERVIKVTATDKDLNAKLQYQIKGYVKATTKAGVAITNLRNNYNANEAFRINPETGDILVNGVLRHDVAAVIIFTVEVRDLNAEVNVEEQVDTTEITIYVQSFKDTNPVFKNKGWTSSKPVVNVKVKEEMPIGSTLFTLTAEDPVTQSPISNFQLVDTDDLEFFNLLQRSGELMLKKRLDYEALTENVFEFQVKATSDDGTRSTITKVNITVENVNDNAPIFDQSSYHATLIENKVYPEKVITVHATDLDASLSLRDIHLGYHKVLYSLQGENSAFFNINNITGEITIAPNQTIDRERNSKICLIVKAEDSPGMPSDSKQSVVDLSIDILDVNDNAPEFTQKNYTAVIQENVPEEAFVVKVFANDPDEGPGGEIRYDLVDEGEVKGFFRINPLNGEIKTKRELTGKGRSEPYELTVRAQDNGGQVQKQESLWSDVKVTLYIGDVSANDGIPYFISPKIGEFGNVYENATINSRVFKVRASDPDSPNTPSGTLFYRIQNDTADAGAFEIDENTGWITTAIPLDRETKDIYNVILEVFDNGQPRQSVTRILKINVLDVDDHEPKFEREFNDRPLEMAVLEGEPIGTIVGNLTAMDKDIGENGEIDYIITDGNADGVFEVERTNDSRALIRTTREIDRELVESFTITIKCYKFKTKPPFTSSNTPYDPYDLSEIRVQIKIQDVDDNLPQFSRKNPSVGIRINVPIDTVIATIHATDIDAEAAPIVLMIDNVTFIPQFYKRAKNMSQTSVGRLFTLNNKTGELRTGGSFTNYVDGYFQLRIRANNSDNVKRHTFNNLKVFVIRDKSLLKFVFARPPGEIQGIIQPFQEQLQKKLKPMHLEVHILDTQVLTRPDMSLDFTSTSSCFQIFRNGAAIPLIEMQKLMDSNKLKQELFDTYVEFGVSQVESCSLRRQVAAASLMSSPGTWLVIIAAFIGIAAIIATCTACCSAKKYKKHSKRMPTPRPPPEPFGVGVPAVFYSEPIYGPL
ncbi:cadherin-23 [Episyrphus balteatus]|uniref:cadherin-23 n=1 Tax=Episyrphus balteatus TaxID=286459 RepID=UPI00248693E6|nr:cadherin-23 [Episyrphus balteatus]